MLSRNLDFIAAAVFALLAVYARAANLGMWLALLFIVAAGSSLISGLIKRANARKLNENPITLTPEQVATIRDLKAQGKGYVAIKQVRLWYRYADLKTAVELVEQVS
ncbi:hypothetical protein CKALI_02995 [Corynebacterium kalinowskii]|uniref:Uncharacterized protein n=1 Tax=Corynebacterium kalinowskii TaxID=2675216 RepID=A0A6B8V8V2_9CORY|nr:hypothetical protein [Corynebacterium kalinowskii]QGU01482.1 hypothetical protein CKALI_02995 [Corynebacterium kalinowskii]